LLRCVVAAALALAASVGAAAAHGGGGGHGGHFVTVGIYGAAAPALPPAVIGNTSAIHTVAIVSAIGQTLQINRHLGLWNDSSKSVDITDWKLDDRATADLRKWLGGRFAFRDVPYDAAALAEIPNGAWDTSTTDLENFLRMVPHDGIDAFIVVRPDLERNTSGIQGLGTTNGNYPGGAAPVREWANYEIDIVDAKTLKEISKCYARAQSREGAAPSFAAYTVGNNLDPGDAMIFTPVQRLMLHGQFGYMVDNTILETVRALQLGVALPSPGARELVDIPADKDPLGKYKTVAIVSVVGDTLEFVHSGMTIFTNTNDMLQTPGSGEDATVEALIRSSLAKHFVVQDVAVDRAALVTSRLADYTGWKQTVQGLPSVPGLDAFVVVMKYSTNIPGMKSRGTGLGVWNYSAIASRTSVFAFYDMALVDAHTFKIITARMGIMSPKSATPVPFQTVSDTLWPEKPPAASAAQLVDIHADVDALIADSIPETMMRLGLTGQYFREPSGTPQPPPPPADAAIPSMPGSAGAQ
jgi:hypothetical protein